MLGFDVLFSFSVIKTHVFCLFIELCSLFSGHGLFNTWIFLTFVNFCQFSFLRCSTLRSINNENHVERENVECP